MYTAVDHNWGMPGSFLYVRCTSCGLAYQECGPDGPTLSEAYPPGYGGTASTAEEAEKRIATGANKRRAQTAETCLRPGRLLYVGCGGGFFMEFMRRRGWEVEGVDWAAEHTAYARERLGLSAVWTGEWPGARVDERRYDLVTMLHVIEHAPDPVAAVAAARQALRPGGMLLVETPNVASWPARMFGPHWVTLDAPRHVVLFSRRTLRACLERAGLVVADVRTYSPSTMEYSESVRHALRALLRMAAQRPRGRSTPPPPTRGLAGVDRQDTSKPNALLAAGHAVERTLYRCVNAAADAWGSGCNLLALGRKP